MPAERVVVLGDAHLGHAPVAVRDALHGFLHAMPDIATHLIINGDLFEFWFEYRTVIPREAFATLAELSRLPARGVRLTLIGGNHDRWAGTFWQEELGATFFPRRAELLLAGHTAVVEHGDGRGDPAPASRVLQAIVHHPATAQVFRWVHPDIGLRLVRRLARRFPGKWELPELRRRSATAQADYARRVMGERTMVDLLVLGHTHVATLEEVAPGRWYLNPGAWLDGYRYALITPQGPELRTWSDE